jgi:hypothetical protein
MIKPEIFMHTFDGKKSICSEFGIDENTLDGCHVYLAYYHIGSYGCDSSAFLLYENQDGDLFEVNGGHCSCHGLSEESYSGGPTQWEPEHTTPEALNHRLTNGSLGSVGGYDDEGYERESKIVVDYLLASKSQEVAPLRG